jgi:hypothetical protein
VQRRFAHLQGLQHGREVLAGVEHRVGVRQLPHNLLRTVPLPSPRRHRESLSATPGPLDSHNIWNSFCGAGHSSAVRHLERVRQKKLAGRHWQPREVRDKLL